MNDKLAKRARREARTLAVYKARPAEEQPPGDLRYWEDCWLELFVTPRQRRRAEQLAARKLAKGKR